MPSERTPITYHALREIGFRFVSHHTDPLVHMLASVDSNHDTGLEIAPYHKDLRKWCIWLRSDISHSKCRFCFIRSVETMDQVIRLMEAITDAPILRTSRDEAEFSIALALEMQDCERRRREYIMDDRWGRIPGYL